MTDAERLKVIETLIAKEGHPAHTPESEAVAIARRQMERAGAAEHNSDIAENLLATYKADVKECRERAEKAEAFHQDCPDVLAEARRQGQMAKDYCDKLTIQVTEKNDLIARFIVERDLYRESDRAKTLLHQEACKERDAVVAERDSNYRWAMNKDLAMEAARADSARLRGAWTAWHEHAEDCDSCEMDDCSEGYDSSHC